MRILDSEIPAFKTGQFMKFGKVSSNTPDHAARVVAFQAAGCERIFSEPILLPLLRLPAINAMTTTTNTTNLNRCESKPRLS